MSADPSAARAIAVLGPGGFLGSAVVRALRARVERWVPILLGRDPTCAPGLSGVAVDGARPGAVAAALVATAPAAVVLCTALARGGDCTRDPGLAERLNTELPGEVAAACRRVGARLVHVSTDLVHGRRPPPPGGHREDAPTAPLDVYGASKAAGERAVLAACPDALVVRLPLLCGDSHGRGLGASDALLADVAAGREVVLFDDEWRTPLDVHVAARALLALVPLRASGLLNLPGPERLTRAEFGRRVLAGAGLWSDTVRVAPRSALGLEHTRPSDVTLLGERARLLLGDGWNTASRP